MGQRAVVRFTASTSAPRRAQWRDRTHGADAAGREEGESYYAVRIRIADGELARLDGLEAVMACRSRLIQTTPRTVVSHLVKPLGDQIARAFKGR